MSDIKTPYTGVEGMLPQMKGTLTILNEKSPCLSLSLVNSFPLLSISKCRSSYEADFTVSVVSFYVKFFGVDAMYQVPETRIV